MHELLEIDGPALLERWMVALESSLYEQVRYKARDGDRFCATGLLCEVSGLGKWSEVADYDNAEDGEPIPLAWSYQIPGQNPAMTMHYLYNLTGLPIELVVVILWNDSEQITFKEIASRLREASPSPRYSILIESPIMEEDLVTSP